MPLEQTAVLLDVCANVDEDADDLFKSLMVLFSNLSKAKDGEITALLRVN